jgi:DNA sulfur modification protein DndC
MGTPQDDGPSSTSHPLGPLTLSGELLQALERQTQETYLSDSRPWVIGYSGGKDSTAVVQHVWNALSALPREKLTKPVYVISSDTLVESPVIVDQIRTTLSRIETTAAERGLPFKTDIVKPDVRDTFWVNLIGKGYPAPYKRFRWCTDRMKIQPANRFIKATAEKYGEVVLVLGVRRTESSARAQVMSLHKRHGEALSRHSDMPAAWVYTPIEDWTTNDVWTFLLQVASPWGNNNRDLVAMYRNANAGECPLVVDTKTPSCGNSRFGCWVCTVVERDRTMEAMIENGEEWMTPMLEFRDYLVTTQDPAQKRGIRDIRRRDGRVHLWGENKEKVIWGPYKFQFRQELLARLLRTQNAVRDSGPESDMELITMAELEEIRRIWRMECADWEDTLPKIWEREVGQPYAWLQDDSAMATAEEAELLRTIATEHDVDPKMLSDLIDLEKRNSGLHRRAAIYNEIGAILKRDWRTEEEVFEKLEEEALARADDELTES